MEMVRGPWLRCLVALTAEVFGTWLTNVYLYPHFIGIAPEARDISSTVAVATLVVLAIVALNKPASINEGVLTPAALTSYSLGYMLILIGLWQGSPAALIAGVCLRSAGSRWIVVLAGISLCALERRDCMLCIALAFGLSYLLRIPFSFVGYDAAVAVLVSLIFVMYAACRPLALSVLRAMTEATSAREASITEPASYLPFAHALFAAIFVFRIAYGFALTFESVDGIPQTTMLGIIPLGLLLVLALMPRQPRADILYEAAALLVVAGFLTIIVLNGRADVAHASLVNGLLFAGSECFEVLMWFALASIGARNPANALAVLAWGRAASSFGLLCGATFGHWANAVPDSLGISSLVAGVLFGFVAVNLTALKGFSFQGTIEGVQPVVALRVGASPADAAAPAATADVDRGDGEGETRAAFSGSLVASCDEVARAFRLTPREGEILGLLAHGRNAPYIQEKLVLSRNTVKTHVQNIYAKLGVHSQQELIDVVESFGDEGGA
ncbi:helix-turn-helix transcriptional regulator [Adlercreutzia caecimuris]|uniref:helix-turn-helix transcriptional regulator n=2 Tax=Adlercreutzia caecimuris TaxID=671266 RepID=UPI00272AC72A|nr:helix-turn-helix transcriptional regulator [Adlercreutzia caecimuris]